MLMFNPKQRNNSTYCAVITQISFQNTWPIFEKWIEYKCPFNQYIKPLNKTMHASLFHTMHGYAKSWLT